MNFHSFSLPKVNFYEVFVMKLGMVVLAAGF